jgi:RNA polymerase sigma-70 factor (ECF subfamily)
MRSIEGPEAVRSFEDLQARSPALSRFGSPVWTAAFLAHEGSDLQEKDQILRGLVREVHDKGPARRIAHVLLLLGLWPGLDAVFRRRRRLFRGDVQDLDTEIIDQFTAQVQRVPLQRVACLAATLVLNTEREIIDARIRERRFATSCEPATLEALPAPPPSEQPPPSLFGLPSAQSDVQDVASLRRWLEPVVGRDLDLVVETVLHGKTRLEVATTMGISHAAARKRLERALTRARHAFLRTHPSQQTTPSAFVS